LLLIRRAFAANFVPALALWCAALSLFLLWQFHTPTHAALESLARLKERGGIGFSMLAQSVAVGVLPFWFQRFQRGTHRRTDGRDLPFLVLMWALQGAVVDVFYRFQAVWWGTGSDPKTLIIKVVCDLGVFAPLVAMPFAVLCFAFKDAGYSWVKTRAMLGRNWIRQRVAPVYFSALVVWTPTLFVLYALPLPLQFPFQAVVGCLWGLILVVLTSQKTAAA